MASDKKINTRQRMINLMYLVFIAMLALNIPTEVLDGFDLVNENIQRTIENTSERNKQMYGELDNSYRNNPEKSGVWYNRAQEIKTKTDSLYNLIQSLKIEIAQKTDGKKADVNNLKSKDNLDAAAEVMLAPMKGKGKILKNKIDSYRNTITSLINDQQKINIINTELSTEPTPRAKSENKDWLAGSFESMPSVAVLTYLSELQSNIKQAEGEALNSLLKNIDVSDFRVNELNAFVIPESKIVMRGMSYKANVVLAAIDTTQRPKVIVNNKEIANGLLEIAANTLGNQHVKGHLEMLSPDGSIRQIPFAQDYTVIEPMATVAPLLMDVVYAGIDNELSISVPGVATQDVSVNATGGSLVRKGNNWIVRPTGGIGTKLTVSVSARVNGVQRTMANKEFRIRKLPDPSAFIAYTDDKGVAKSFKQGGLSRSVLLNAKGIQASIDDGILNIPFSVLSFRTVMVDAMGNAMQEMSSGGSFSERQLEQIRRMDRGKLFFISGIKVKGPDGIERDIAPMEIRLK